MDMLNGWLNNAFDDHDNVNQLNKQVNDLYTPSVLTQGKQFHNSQAANVNALQMNLLNFNEPIMPAFTNTSPFVNTSTYGVHWSKYPYMEGFDTIQTNALNSSEWQDTTNFSSDYAQKLNRYTTEFPSLIDHSRSYAQDTDRTINYRKNTFSLNQDINNKYNITSNKEGCYKQAPGAELLYQPDMNNVTLDTCKKRTSDLAYAGFSIKNKADQQLGCYLTNDLNGNKMAGIATKPQTSLAFKTNKNAMVGSLLMNGQLGLFNGTTFDVLDTDLPAVAGCAADGSKTLINPDTIMATWGGNC